MRTGAGAVLGPGAGAVVGHVPRERDPRVRVRLCQPRGSRQRAAWSRPPGGRVAPVRRRRGRVCARAVRRGGSCRRGARRRRAALSRGFVPPTQRARAVRGPLLPCCREGRGRPDPWGRHRRYKPDGPCQGVPGLARTSRQRGDGAARAAPGPGDHRRRSSPRSTRWWLATTRLPSAIWCSLAPAFPRGRAAWTWPSRATGTTLAACAWSAARPTAAVAGAVPPVPAARRQSPRSPR